MRAQAFAVALAAPALAASAPALAAPALAAPARAPDDAAVDDAAKARYGEGLRLYKKKKYDEARAAFLQANALRRHPMTTFMLAQSSLKAGRWLDAARGFDAYLGEATDVSPKLSAAFESGRREVHAHLGRLHLDVPPDSEVLIDGDRPPSIDPPLINVLPGIHTISVTHLGQTKTETVDATAGKTTEVRPSFTPKALVPAEDTRSRPTPAPPPAATGGVGGAGGGGVEGATESGSILSPPAVTWPVYAAGAVGLGGFATAAIVGGLQANASHGVDVATQTLTRNGKAPSSCDTGTGWATAAGQNENDERAKYAEACSTLQRNQNFSSSTSGIFGVALLAGIAGTALAAGWFFFAPKDHAASSPDGGPLVTPWLTVGSGASAGVSGRF